MIRRGIDADPDKVPRTIIGNYTVIVSSPIYGNPNEKSQQIGTVKSSARIFVDEISGDWLELWVSDKNGQRFVGNAPIKSVGKYLVAFIRKGVAEPLPLPDR